LNRSITEFFTDDELRQQRCAQLQCRGKARRSITEDGGRSQESRSRFRCR
jgi:hypothetical protein